MTADIDRKPDLKLLVLLALALCAFLATSAKAGEPQTLPADLNLVGVDGTALTTADIGGSEKWLLIYVRNNRASEVLLGEIDETSFPGITSHIVVIAGGMNQDRLKQTSSKFPGLAKAAWYGDSSLALATAMKINGAPVMFGMQDRNARWDLSGVLFDSEKLKSIVTSWFNPPQANP